MSKHFGKQIFILIVLGILVLGMNSCQKSLPASKVGYELQAPLPPFKRIPSAKPLSKKTRKLKFYGRTLSFGSKKLVVDPSGELSFISDGLKLFTLYANVNTKFNSWLPNMCGSAVPRKARDGQLAITESSIDDKNQSFSIKGYAPLFKGEAGKSAKAAFEQKVTAIKDGKISISYTLKVPKKHYSGFKRFALYTALAYPVYSEASVRISKKNKSLTGFVAPAPVEMLFAPNNSFAEFGLKADFKGSVMRITPENLKSVMFGYYPDKTPKKESGEDFIYELKLLLEAKSTEPVMEAKKNYGGVDFKKIDDLGMPDYAICRNLMQNPSFERGRMFLMNPFRRQYYAIDSGFQIDSQEMRFGKNSLKLSSIKTKAKSLRFMMSPVPVFPGKYTLSYYIKCDNPENALKVRAAAKTSGYKSLGSKIVKLTEGWRRHSFTFEVKNPAAAVVSFTAWVKEFANVWIDGVQLERGEKVTAFAVKPIEGLLISSQKGNFLKPGEPINAKLRMISAKPATKGTVTVKVKDFFGKIRHFQKLKFDTGANGEIELPLDFEGLFTRGIYMVAVAYNLDSGEQFNEFFRFSIMDFMKGKHKNRQMFSNSYGGFFPHDAHPGLEVYLKRCKKLGVGAMNSVYQPTPSYSNMLKEYGIYVTNTNVINTIYKHDRKRYPGERFRIFDDYYYGRSAKTLIKDFNAEGDGTLTKGYLDKLSQAVKEKIKIYPGAEYFGFMGESIAKWPDWYRNDLKSFIDVRVATFKAIKDAGKKITNSSSCNMEPRDGIKKIETQLKAYDGRIKFDALNCHTYLPAGPYALENNIKAFLGMIAKYGYGDTPVFFPEGMHYGPYEVPLWGVGSVAWSAPRAWYGGTLSYDMGWIEKQSAAWFARSWLTCMKFMPQIFSVCSGAQNMVNNFQLDIDMTPRAYQKIVNTLSHLLGDARFVKDVSFAPNCKCLVFESDDGHPIVALWGQNQKVDYGFEDNPQAMVDFGELEPKIFDLMETQRDLLKDNAGKAEVPVSTFPFFFCGEEGETKRYCEVFAKATIAGANALPLALSAKASSPEFLELTVKNLISRQVKGSLTVNGESREINVKPGSKESLTAKLPQKLQAGRIIEEKINVAMEEVGNPNKLKSTISFPGFLCQKTSGTINIDGDLNDWRDIPAIKLKNKNYSSRFGSKDYPESDFKGQFRVAWNKDYLYVAVEIVDNHFVHKEEQRNGAGNRWNNDSLQIYMDTFCDAREKGKVGYDANDYDFAVFPNAAGDAAQVFRYLSVNPQLALGTTIFKENVFEPNIKSGFKKTSTGYVYEVAFPAKYILPVKLEKNYSIGFGLYVNDRDEEKHVKQALTVTPPGTGCWRAPYLYPVMLLAE